MTYTVSTKNYLGNKATIVRRTPEGHEVPVMNIIPGEVDFPADVKHLAANIASLMNGNKPLYDINIGNRELYWVRHETGFEFKVRERVQ